MSLRELMDEIERLSLADQLRLAEAIHQNVRAKLQGNDALERLRGLLATENPPPTDTDIQTEYVDYLVEKYR